MIDLQLTPAHDLRVGRDNDLVLVDGVESVAQEIRIMLLTFLGEWFLDTDVGIPYFERILVKNPQRGPIETLLRARILGVDGVDAINAFDIQYDPETREAVMAVDAHTTYGLVKVVARQLTQG